MSNGDTVEVLCTPTDQESDQDILGLYARVTDLQELHIEYDVYTVRMQADESISLGEITELSLP